MVEENIALCGNLLLSCNGLATYGRITPAWACAKSYVCNCPLNIKLGDFKVVRLFFCYFIGDFNQLTSEWPSYITITVTYCKFKILTSRVI